MDSNTYVDFTFNIRMDLNTYVDLLHQLQLSWLTYRSLLVVERAQPRFSVFNVYRFMLFAGQTLKTIYYFLMQNEIQIPPKIVSVHPYEGKLSILTTFEFEFKLHHTLSHSAL